MAKKYEGMFLFDPAVTADWDAVQVELNRLMERAEARVLEMHRWDERRLAYEIRGRKRAIYALVFFEASPTKIGPLERDAQLSESVLRCLVLDADHLTDEEIREIASRPADHSAAEAERIGSRWGGGGFGGGGGGGGRGGERRGGDRDRSGDRGERREGGPGRESREGRTATAAGGDSED